MKLTVRRNQEPTRKGANFVALFQLYLSPVEQDLVQRYKLEQFRMGGYDYTVQDLLRGVRYEGVAIDNSQIRLHTETGVKVNAVLRAQREIRESCERLLVLLDNLGHYDDIREFDFAIPVAEEATS